MEDGHNCCNGDCRSMKGKKKRRQSIACQLVVRISSDNVSVAFSLPNLVDFSLALGLFPFHSIVCVCVCVCVQYSYVCIPDSDSAYA